MGLSWMEELALNEMNEKRSGASQGQKGMGMAEIKTCSDALLAYLGKNKISRAFFLPGGGAMHLNDALARSGMDHTHCHHEQAAAIAAEAYGRVKGEAGFVMVTTGPGSTNILTPVAGAWIESIPLLIVSGQVKRPDLKAPGTVRQKGVQEVDVAAMARPVCKWAKIAMKPECLLPMAKEALEHALSGRMGPVWLDVPLDVQGAPWNPEWNAQLEASPEIKARALDDNALLLIRELALNISKSAKPLFLAGHGVRLAGLAGDLLSFADEFQIPCSFTWNAMDMMPWDHPLCAGRPGNVAARCSNINVQNADCFFSLGARLDNIVTAYNPKKFAKHAFKAVCDIDEHELEKLEGSAQSLILAPAKDFLEELAKELRLAGKPDTKAWLAKIKALKETWGPMDSKAPGVSGEISSMELALALSDALPEKALIPTGSSGLCVEAFYSNFKNKEGQRIFLTSGLGAMGYGLAAGIGASLASGRKTALVESDGSLLMNIQELATLKALNLPMVIFLMDNGGYASIRATQRGYFNSRFIGTGAESGVWMPDWMEIARAFGLPSAEVSDLADLPGALKKAWDEPGPFLLRVKLKKDEALWPKCSALPQKDGSMLSMPLEDMSPLLDAATLESLLDFPLDEASKKARETA